MLAVISVTAGVHGSHDDAGMDTARDKQMDLHRELSRVRRCSSEALGRAGEERIRKRPAIACSATLDRPGQHQVALRVELEAHLLRLARCCIGAVHHRQFALLLRGRGDQHRLSH